MSPNVCFLCGTESKDLGAGSNSGLRNSRPQPATCEPQRQRETIQIPKSMTAGPFLKVGLTSWSADVFRGSGCETWPLSTPQHTALTPAQKEYLYRLTASYSSARVRNLITQHYMNVLHRCVPTGEEHRGQSVLWSRLQKARASWDFLQALLWLCDITVGCTACLVEPWFNLKLYSPVPQLFGTLWVYWYCFQFLMSIYWIFLPL